jgi:hypothetical protein
MEFKTDVVTPTTIIALYYMRSKSLIYLYNTYVTNIGRIGIARNAAELYERC